MFQQNFGMDEDDLPLTGSPCPIRVYAMENTTDNDRIGEIKVMKQIGLSITTKKLINVHFIPESPTEPWELVATKQFPKVETAHIRDTSEIIVISSRPFLFSNDMGQIISAYKRPSNMKGSEAFLTSVLYKDTLCGFTKTGALCSWDLRVPDPKIFMNLSGINNITTATINSYHLSIGLKNGTILVFDHRKMDRRLATLNINDALPYKINCDLDSIISNDEEPWNIAFKYQKGTAGIYDLMAKNVFSKIENTKFEQTEQLSSFAPVLFSGIYYVGFYYSTMLTPIVPNGAGLKLSYAPVSLAVSEMFDGIFVATESREIFHVF